MSKSKDSQKSQENQGAIATTPLGGKFELTEEQKVILSEIEAYSDNQARRGKPGMILAQIGQNYAHVTFIPNERVIKMFQSWGEPIPEPCVIP